MEDSLFLMSSSNYSDPNEIQAIPGFGFYTRERWQFIFSMTTTTIENATREDLCHTLMFLWKQNMLDYKPKDAACPPIWDKVSCIPATAVGSIAVLPCIEKVDKFTDDKRYSTEHNTTRECLSSGDWAPKTNYCSCTQNCGGWEPPENTIDESNIYLTGYLLSMLALAIAVFIFLYFKEMRCLRHKIHTNLFLTFLVTDLCWLFQFIIGHLETHQEENNSLETAKFNLEASVYCTVIVLHRYFHLATFFWMFVEGLFLFLQVQASFSFGNMKFRHCFTIGWGSPLLIALLWSLLIVCYPEDNHFNPNLTEFEKSKNLSVLLTCPFFTVNSNIDALTYAAPICIILAANFVFLTWVMVLVVSKLRSNQAQAAGAAVHFHLKAAKALLVIVPLLGITYLITIWTPPSIGVWSTVYISIRAFLLSFQGLFVTLPYCFLNGEVLKVMNQHWSRWKTTRDIEQSRPHSARNSLLTAGFLNDNNVNRNRRPYSYQNNTRKSLKPEDANMVNFDHSQSRTSYLSPSIHNMDNKMLTSKDDVYNKMLTNKDDVYNKMLANKDDVVEMDGPLVAQEATIVQHDPNQGKMKSVRVSNETKFML